jgi:hypothetical protein
MEELVIRIKPNGDSVVDFLPVSFSEFIIKNMYDKERRERFLKDAEERGQPPRILCG